MKWNEKEMFSFFVKNATECRWKSLKFSITQILREIKIGEFWISRFQFFLFMNFCTFWKLKFPNLLKVRNTPVLELQEFQNWFHVKSKWQKNPEMSKITGFLNLRNFREMHWKVMHENLNIMHYFERHLDGKIGHLDNSSDFSW